MSVAGPETTPVNAPPESEAGLSFLSPMPELVESWVGELLCDV